MLVTVPPAVFPPVLGQCYIWQTQPLRLGQTEQRGWEISDMGCATCEYPRQKLI
jgi:hypothetical protein